jgi:D-alanyl-D-alanine carboxypeptidase
VDLRENRRTISAVRRKGPQIEKFRAVGLGMLLCLLAACERRPGMAPPPSPLPPPHADVAPTPATAVAGAAPTGPAFTLPADCAAGAYAEAAADNARTLSEMPFNLFGRPEMGWEVYAPVVAREISTDCPANSEGFARALAQWRPGGAKDGRVTPAVLTAVKASAQARRPIVKRAGQRVCPDPPSQEALSTARREESYGGKTIELRTGALEAYRAMAAAARDEEPQIRRDARFLTIFSAYRSPEYDAARCLRDNNCNGVTRAVCSPHRTGLAMDIYVGQAPDYGPDSSADPNRLAQSRTPAYAWLVRNAGRFGFVGYAFEPWHWEWTGEAP